MNVLGLAALAALSVAQLSPGPTIEVRGIAAEQPPSVHVLVQVLDHGGAPVAGLISVDFTVFENGTAVPEFTVRQSHPEEEPVAVSIAIDTSGSMTEADIAGAVAGADAVIDRLAPEDQLELVAFNTDITVLKTYADPLDRTVLTSLVPMQDTKLNDTLVNAIDRILEVDASRRAIIILTDGVDEGSLTLNQPLLDLVASAGVAVHTVGLGDVESRMLEALAEQSSGSFRRALDPAELASLYAEIADSLRTEYRLTYESSAPAGDHEVTIVARVDDANASATIPFAVASSLTGAAESAESTAESSFSMTLAILALSGFGLVALALLMVFARRGARAQRAENAQVIVGARSVTPQAAPAGLFSSFHLVGDSGVFPVAGPTVVGRDPRADIVVGDETVSRSHARLQEVDGGLLVTDLSSANGTSVNGQLVTERLAHPGDIVGFGDLVFELRAPS